MKVWNTVSINPLNAGAVTYTLQNLKWEKEKIYAVSFSSVCKLQFWRARGRWSQRNLTGIAKIRVIRTLCISKINFAISSIESPEWFINETKNLLEKFWWNGKPSYILKHLMLLNKSGQGF